MRSTPPSLKSNFSHYLSLRQRPCAGPKLAKQPGGNCGVRARLDMLSEVGYVFDDDNDCRSQ